MEVITVIAVVIYLLAVAVKYASESSDRKLALPGPGQGMDSTPPEQQPAIPRGYAFSRHRGGWTLASEASAACRVRGEARYSQHKRWSGELRVDVDAAAALSPSIARLFAGELRDWTWVGGAWELRLGRTELALAAEPGGDSLLEEALERLPEAVLLHRRTTLALTFGPEAQAAFEAPLEASAATLAAIGKVLAVDVAQTDPKLAIHLAERMDSPVIWLVLLESPRTATASYRKLLNRGRADPFESEAIDRALERSATLETAGLEALFLALERRDDPRLGPLLAHLLPLGNRALILGWLERRGDTSALDGLEDLLGYVPAEGREAVERAITAIRFRREAALAHTSGGLSLGEEGGALALAEAERAETS